MSWKELLLSLRDRGLKAPKLVEIYMPSDEATARTAYRRFCETFGQKHHRAADALRDSIGELLAFYAFYAFPAEPWSSIRTTNPIESAFATVRLRTKRTKGSGSAQACLTMVFKLMQCAEKRRRKMKAFKLLVDVKDGVVFVDGVTRACLTLPTPKVNIPLPG